MAEIYRARTVLNGIMVDVAIKRLHAPYNADDEFIVMLTDEARITSLFDHENIARTYEFGVVDGQHFLALEYIDGLDLRKMIRRLEGLQEVVRPELAIFIMERALAGLHAAHEQCDETGRAQEIIHRDFTPSNILLSYRGDVKLVDFGIAKARMSRSRTQAGFIKGKLKYMSPEQTRKRALDRRSDIFAAGVVLYVSATGRWPFVGEDDDALIRAIRDQEHRAPSSWSHELDAGFDAIINRALAKDREQRFDTADEFRQALEEWRRHSNLPPTGPEALGTIVQGLFSLEREDEKRLYQSFSFDDDPTPTAERQTYTRIVGVTEPSYSSISWRVDGGTGSITFPEGVENPTDHGKDE